MELTKEQLDDIIFKVTEGVLLRIPEVLGNLMQNHAETNKLTKSFYEKFPEFKNDPNSVRSIVGMLEQNNAGMKYENILEKAAPLIKERMKTVKSLNIETKPEKSSLDLNIDMNGEL